MSPSQRDVTVSWFVDDGYAGKPRPQTTQIDRHDWDEAQEGGPDDVEKLIVDSIQDDFECRISWYRDGDPEVPA